MSGLEDQIARMKGPCSALFTPFDSRGEVSDSMLAEIIEFQLANGIEGFFVTGSTGEGLLLSYRERLQVIRHAVEVCRGRVPVIAHVGHPSTDFSTRLAKEAASAGVDWISSVGPIYHGTTFEGALRHYGQISRATELPFMVYALNATVVPERDSRFFELPNVCGLKYTGANFFSVQQLNRQVDRPLALMSGFDEQFVASLSFGFAGGIGTTLNFAPQLYARIYRNYHLGNIGEAARLQEQINRVTHLIVSFENWSYRKAVMKYIGLDCGPCRAPYAPLTDSEYGELAGRLEQLGVLTGFGGGEPARA